MVVSCSDVKIVDEHTIDFTFLVHYSGVLVLHCGGGNKNMKKKGKKEKMWIKNFLECGGAKKKGKKGSTTVARRRTTRIF